MDFTELSINQIGVEVSSGKIKATEVVQFFLKRIKEGDSKINSVITLNENALIEADLLDQKIKRGEKVGPLAGVPIGVKDMICTKGIRTTAGSKILENFIPNYDATLIKNLKDAGAIVLAKLNQDEFAMGSSNESSFFGSCKNPWNLEHVPGGSSGGSAAAQAARFVKASLGTDTGGSIRQPSSFCHTVGIKPTYGRVSRYGVIAYASSLDQAGPITSSVEDAALMLEVMSGKDPLDATSSKQSVPNFSSNQSVPLANLKVGMIQEYQNDAIERDVQETLDEAVDVLKNRGCEIVPLSIPEVVHSVPIYYLIATSEASSNLARYDGVRFGFRNTNPIENLEEFYSFTRGQGFGKEVKRRILLGTFCLSSGYIEAYYQKACQVRRILQNQFIEAFKKCDVILSPVSAFPAFKLGGKISKPLAMYMNDIFTTSTNLAGLPGMSVPFGMSHEGLPIGVQLTAGHYKEETLFAFARELEKQSRFKGARPHGI